MDKTTKILMVIAGLMLIGSVAVYPHEKMSSEYIQVIKHRVVDVIEPSCADVQPQTIMIHGLPHTKATPNHEVPCSIMYDGGFD
jgi:hypothetical protein